MTALNIRVFIASPSDVSEERNRLSLVVSELHDEFSNEGPVDVRIDLLKWENVRPGIADTPQGVIDRQIGTFDVFIGIMWKRFGTPTGDAESGTEHEFNRALGSWKRTGSPEIMMYFSKQKYCLENKDECDQVASVLRFKQQLPMQGVLFREVRDPLEFEREIRKNLRHYVKQRLRECCSYPVY